MSAAYGHRQRRRIGSPESPVTPPGVLLTYGVLWVLLGFGVVYVAAGMDDNRALRLSLTVMQYGAWTIGGSCIMIAGYRLYRHYRRGSERDG